MTVFNGSAFFERTLRGRFRELKKSSIFEGNLSQQLSQPLFSAAFLNSVSQQPFSAAFLSSFSQQPFSAAFLSNFSQLLFSRLSQQQSSATILLWSAVVGHGGQPLTSSSCSQGLVVNYDNVQGKNPFATLSGKST